MGARDLISGVMGVQTEKPLYEEIEEMLGNVEPPPVALVEQRVDSPPTLSDIRAAVGEALRSVDIPTGSVAVGVGSRGVGKISDVVAALVGFLKEAGAELFVVPAMGSHGASTAEGQADVLAHLGVSEERIGCPVLATMETVKIGETPAGVFVFMDRNAHEAVESGKVAFGLATVENAHEEPCKVVAIPAADLEAGEAPLLEEAKRKLARLPFDDMDVLVVDEIGKNVSGDGADPNVTGRYPTTAASGGPRVGRMVYLGLTEETGGNANGLGMADVVTERLVAAMDRPSTYMNALTSTTPQPVKIPMTMPTEEMAIAAALTMCAGVAPSEARLVRIRNTLSLGRIWVSEALLADAERDERLEVLGEPGPLRFDADDPLR